MGTFSEIDLENKMKNEQRGPLSASEAAALRDEARQEAEAEKAKQMLDEMADDNPDEDETEEIESNSTQPAQTESEDEKRKAHEEAEAKRKAEWEAKKQAREEADIMAWEAALAMDDDKLVEASVKRLGDDAERITRRNMKQCVTEFVQVKCYEDMDFARQVMHPRKSMINCFRYINRKAREFIEQEMKDNDIKPSREGYGSDIPDDLCYQWAVDYFNDMEAPEDKGEDEEEFVPKPYTGGSSKKTTKSKPEKKKEAKKQPAPQVPKPQSTDMQLNIFNMGVE